jgi:hypothetical protein
MAALIAPIVVAAVALPVVGHAQSPTVTRGAFAVPVSLGATTGAIAAPVSPGATTGAIRGALPPGSSVGAIRGSVPVDAVIGVPRTASGATVGVFPSPVTPIVGVGLVPGVVLPTTVIAPRGSLPADATVGALATPLPPGSRLGAPGPDEIAGRLNSQARLSLIDGNYAQGETMLNRSVTIREEVVGPVHPEVAAALEENAQLLRQYNRDAAAAAMETRAQEIRTLLEPPPPSNPPEAF